MEMQYIIMAMHARPIPHDPYNPAGTDNPIRHPSPFVPIRLPIFTPVIWLNEVIVRAISLVGSMGGRPASSREPVGWNESVQRRGLRRMPSDSVESVEEGEGEGVPMQSLPSAQSAATRVRVSRGSRSGASFGAGRKHD